LREGYGYTLRKVEEKAYSLGESIDNSQLSRFEKGKALPSFDKLRALARIFNVSIQNFSDVLDLEEFEPFKPESDDYEVLSPSRRPSRSSRAIHGRVARNGSRMRAGAWPPRSRRSASCRCASTSSARS
jgi:transcriptional regulator with XRE-family HTH domain